MNQEQIAQEIEKLAQTWAAAEVRRDTAFMEQILANGFGNTQYHCKDCGAYCVLKPAQVYSETEQQLVLRACLERCSLRGIARIFAIARQTIVRWFREHWRPKQSNLSRSYGKLSRMNRSTAILSVIFSLFITTCFQLKPIAAQVYPRRLPFLPNGREESMFMTSLKEIAQSLEQLAAVERVTLFDAIAFAPPSAYVRECGDSVQVAQFDIVVLIETTSPESACQVQTTPAYQALVDALKSKATQMHVLVARNANRSLPGLCHWPGRGLAGPGIVSAY